MKYWAVVIMLLLMACGQEKKRAQPQYYFDSLLRRQALYLTKHEASVNKVTAMGKQDSRVTLKPGDTTAWKKELEIFQVIDAINKPINRDSYKIEMKSDDRSNLMIRSFSTSENLPVKYVNIYFKNTSDRIRKIEASYTESNALYHSSRILTMVFEPIRDSAVLTSYSIVGGQKMVMDDSVKYDIKGYLTLGN
ncbi:MAG: hypothetical protein ABI477_08765 [Chryseolinea sp.]